MTYYDRIYEMAVDNHYLATTTMARAEGIPPIELAKLAHRGRLENLARGVYRLSRYVPSENDAYAIAVARVGDNAFLYGESVLGMLELAPTNVSRIWVGTPGRTRLKNAPSELRVVNGVTGCEPVFYDGIRCQPVVNAIRACAGKMMPERLLEAVERARETGYLTASEADCLRLEGVV